MSAELVTYALLSAHAPLAALVQARIFPGHLERGANTPAVIYELVSATPAPAIDAWAATHLTRSRVTVSAIAADYATTKAIRDAVSAAMRNQRGTFGGVETHAILLDRDQPMTFEDETELWHRPIDFVILHQQA